MPSRRLHLFGALVPCLLCAIAAHGGVSMPDLQMTVLVDGADAGIGVPAPTQPNPGNPGLYQYDFGFTGAAWAFGASNSITVDVNQRRITAGFGIENSDDVAHDFTILLSASVAPTTGSSNFGGTVSGSLNDTGADGAALSAFGSGAFTGLVNGVEVHPFLPDLDLTANPGVGATFGPSTVVIGSLPAGPAITDTIGVALRFTLSPGDIASFNSTWIVNQGPVPTPGGLALLGLGGLLGPRRRRRI